MITDLLARPGYRISSLDRAPVRKVAPGFLLIVVLSISGCMRWHAASPEDSSAWEPLFDQSRRLSKTDQKRIIQRCQNIRAATGTQVTVVLTGADITQKQGDQLAVDYLRLGGSNALFQLDKSRVVVHLHQIGSNWNLQWEWRTSNLRYAQLDRLEVSDIQTLRLGEYLEEVVWRIGNRISQRQHDLAWTGRATKRYGWGFFWLCAFLLTFWILAFAVRMLDGRPKHRWTLSLEWISGTAFFYLLTHSLVLKCGLFTFSDVPDMAFRSCAIALFWLALVGHFGRRLTVPHLTVLFCLLSFLLIWLKTQAASVDSFTTVSSNVLVQTWSAISPLRRARLGFMLPFFFLVLVGRLVEGRLGGTAPGLLGNIVARAAPIGQYFCLMTGKPSASSSQANRPASFKDVFAAHAMANFYWAMMGITGYCLETLHRRFGKPTRGNTPRAAKGIAGVARHCQSPAMRYVREFHKYKYLLDQAESSRQRFDLRDAFDDVIKAVAGFETLSVQNADILQSEWIWRCHGMLGEISLHLGRPQHAIKYLEAALHSCTGKSYEREIQTRRLLMHLHFDLRNFDQAMAVGTAATGLITNLRCRYSRQGQIMAITEIAHRLCTYDPLPAKHALGVGEAVTSGSQLTGFETWMIALEIYTLIHRSNVEPILCYEFAEVLDAAAAEATESVAGSQAALKLNKRAVRYRERAWRVLDTEAEELVAGLEEKPEDERYFLNSILSAFSLRLETVARMRQHEATRLMAIDPVESARLAHRALHRFQQLNNTIGVGQCLVLLSEAAAAMGDYEEARVKGEAALEVAVACGHAAMRRHSHFLLGRYFEHRQCWGKALASYEQSAEAFESVREQVPSWEMRSAYFNDKTPIYEALVLCCLKLGRRGLALSYAEQAKSRVLIDMLGNEWINPRQDVPAELLRQEEQLRFEIHRLYREGREDTTQVDGSGPENLRWRDAQRSDKLDALQQRWVKLWAEIRGVSPELASLRVVEPLTTNDILALLPNGTAMIYYYQMRGQVIAFVVCGDEVSVQVLDVDGKDLQSFVDQVRGFSPQGGWRLLAEMYQRLFKPVEQFLINGKIQTLVFVPHGPLHLLPLHAMSAHLDGRKDYLLDRYSVAYAPSATVLRFCQQKTCSCPTSFLGLGNPSGDLSHAEQEVGAIAALYHADPCCTLLQEKATAAALKESAAHFAHIHLACHGYFNPRQPLLSHLQLADGPLTVTDILNDLSLKADLVSLCACESGHARVTNGDEVMGLIRAILYAGTPTVLASLWNVDDYATSLMAEEFYRQLLSGSDKAASLRYAQRRLRDMTVATALLSLRQRHAAATDEQERTRFRLEIQALEGKQAHHKAYGAPFFWAALFLVGDPGVPASLVPDDFGENPGANAVA